MNTIDFQTKTSYIARANKAMPDKWPVAIDIGYSGTKLMSPNCVAVFPSFAVPVDGQIISGRSGDETILYRQDGSDEIWAVGRQAEDMLSPDDPRMTNEAIYNRKRYADPAFRVLAEAALGIAMLDNEYGSPEGRTVRVQTGLPNTYLRADTPEIRDVFTLEEHHFSIKVGTRPWKHFDLRLEEKDVGVMAQPLGTYVSVIADSEGHAVAEAEDISRFPVIIVDPGFGTTDCFTVRAGVIGGVTTFTDVSMHEVFRRTVRKLEDIGISVTVPALQKLLADGKATQFDRRTRQGKQVDISPYLEEANRETALDCAERLATTYNYLLDYRTLIVAGGCPWLDIFRKYFAGLPGLNIISGTANDTLSPIFSNVRGYYMVIA